MGSNVNSPHAVMVPFPAQGHVNPMMQLARKLAVEEGFIITFVNTDHHHQRIIEANSNEKSGLLAEAKAVGIRLVSISDGLDPSESRNQFAKLTNSLETISGPLLCKLIEEMEEMEQDRVTCLISDLSVTDWVFKATKHLNLSRGIFWSALNATYATFYRAQSLVSAGIIPSNGIFKEHKMVEYVSCLPPLHSSQLTWLLSRSDEDNAFLFNMILRNIESARGQWCVSNTLYELEAPVLNSFPKEDCVYPIGPLIPSEFFNTEDERIEPGMTTGFWAEEECLAWLDKQSGRSVIYVAFGSIAILNHAQLEEFALGLEATQRPFLWVLRSDLLNGEPVELPCGFKERTKHVACFVSWAPQLEVLSHTSVACFITHCGWNSTLESITMGVPLLCWPYFADQFLNCSFVVDVWRVGLALKANKEGIVEKGEIKEAVEKLLAQHEGLEIRNRITKLKEIARDSVKPGGSSYINFKKFVDAMKN
uniref:Glycosyltransferase n=1 Tax=Araucaria cunninghamii TaxID=56994 RepID=A0A0D6QYF3_ARACU